MVILRMGRLHRAWCKVHGSHCVAEERQPNGIVGIASTALFHATHSFVRDDIRVSYFETSRLERAMEVDQQVVTGTLFCHPFVVVDHPLVTMVHEVYFQAFHTHIGIMLDDIEMLLHREPREPQENTHTALTTIVHQLSDIYLIACYEWITHILTPSFVQQNIL